MNRREMLVSVAAAALIPSTRLLANLNFNRDGQHICDKKFAKMITDLEHLSWDLNTVPLNPNRLKIAEALLSEDCFEILGTGYLSDREETLANVASGLFLVDPNYQFWDDFVVRTSETSALIFYRMIVSYTWDGVPYTDDIWVTSSYALIKGRWRLTSYHETYSTPE